MDFFFVLCLYDQHLFENLDHWSSSYFLCVCNVFIQTKFIDDETIYKNCSSFFFHHLFYDGDCKYQGFFVYSVWFVWIFIFFMVIEIDQLIEWFMEKKTEIKKIQSQINVAFAMYEVVFFQ